MEFIAAHWLIWLVVALVCAAGFGINWLLVTYGTFVDVSILAYKASQIKKEDLPSSRDEWVGKAVDLSKNQAAAYAKSKILAKIRKIFFSVFVLGSGIFFGLLFVMAMVINLFQVIFG